MNKIGKGSAGPWIESSENEMYFSKSERDLENMFSGCNLPSALQTSAWAENAAWLEFHVQSTLQLFLYDEPLFCSENII